MNIPNIIFYCLIVFNWLLILNLIIYIIIKIFNLKIFYFYFFFGIFFIIICFIYIYIIFLSFHTQFIYNSLKYYKNNIINIYIFKLFNYNRNFNKYKINLLNEYDYLLNILIHDINCAKKTINIVFYICQVGGSIDYIVEVLINAIRRGVYCCLMFDSIGSINFFCSSYFILMKIAGFNILKVIPITFLNLLFQRIDLRQHRKMILIDNYIAYIGSMNMVDPLYFKKYIGGLKFIDIMIRIEGFIVLIINLIFIIDWDFIFYKKIFLILSNFNILFFSFFFNYYFKIITSGPPGFFSNFIHESFLVYISKAKKKLIITTPYLILSDDILHIICNLARFNIEVHIIIPYYNDSNLVYWASRSFFYKLLISGVFIYQFIGGLLHTKSILIDSKCLIGTANLDMRSFFLNSEIISIINDKNFIKKLLLIYKNYMTNSNIINLIVWSKRPYWQRILENICYLFSPLL